MLILITHALRWAHHLIVSRVNCFAIAPPLRTLSQNRMLLQVKGPAGFKDLRTVNGMPHPNYHLAAVALGCLVTDIDYERSLCDTASNSWATGSSLHLTFSIILLHSPPSDPQLLLDIFIADFSGNCSYLLRHNDATLEISTQNNQTASKTTFITQSHLPECWHYSTQPFHCPSLHQL